MFMKRLLKILITESSKKDSELIIKELQRQKINIQIKRITKKKEFVPAVIKYRPDIILSNYHLPQSNGLSFLKLSKKIIPKIPFIIITSKTNEDMAVNSLKVGAWDYVIKENIVRLGTSIKSALDKKSQIEKKENAEAATVESEKKYRQLFENVPVGIYRTTPQGQILMANSKLLELLGYNSFEELSKLNLEKEGFSNKNIRKKFKSLIEKEGQIINYEACWLKKDGSEITVRENAHTVRDKNSKILYYEGIVVDITEQKRLEEQLHHAQKMEAIGRLAGGIAHDFNNLLTIIGGYSEIIRSVINKNNPIYQDIKQIEQATKRGEGLTRQLLAFSHYQVLKSEIINLNQIINQMRKMIKRLIREDVKIVFSLDSELDCIQADPGQIEQVIMNLVVNSSDAMPDGGKLIIETKNIVFDETVKKHVFELHAGNYVMLAISDTGIGMDKEILDHIFEPFFTTKEEGKGTGLGLSTVYGIVKQNKGSIWAYSEINRGTAIKLYFPQAKGEIKITTGSGVSEKPLKGTETILVVEDEEEVRKLICNSLKKVGYYVLDAPNGQVALNLCKKLNRSIDLTLTDLILPKMNGRMLIKNLIPMHPKMKALYMSGYTDDVIAQQGILTKGIKFIQKPITPIMVTRKVYEVLHSNK